MSASRMPAIFSTRAFTRTPSSCNSRRASAPAKHSGAVSRPENCPPPRMSFSPPNFTQAV